jgi:hypothetical protein
MKDAIEIYPPGATVNLQGTDISGIVQEVAIFPEGFVKYGVGWWNGGEYRSAYFQESEVTSSKEPARIGFKSVTG